jgi:Mn2+/Fe2+ NRAMP family transporter
VLKFFLLLKLMFKFLKDIGPGPLVAAAFIGPGTITVCTRAGANFGFQLLWALLISVFATIILQSMSARLGLISRKSLSEAAVSLFSNKVIKYLFIALILTAIVLGNSAYQAGNILGGVLGLEAISQNFEFLIGSLTVKPLVLLMSALAFFLLYLGKYKIIERVLVAMVIIMSISFIITAIITQPNLSLVVKGLFGFHADNDSWLLVLGLIGTTVVPYNLFLHSSLVQEKWANASSLSKMKRDTVLAVGLGGLVSMAILVTGASAQGTEINDVASLSVGLEELYGTGAKFLLAIGMFSAGITSAITAPLAAAYVTRGCLGWKPDMKAAKFRAVWMVVLLIGVLFAHVGKSPIQIIQFAQVANALLLPLIVVLLLWIMNQQKIMGAAHKNTLAQNIFGVFVLSVILILTIKTFLTI